METDIIKDVKKYYGEILKNSSDLKTSACCPTEASPKYIREILSEIHIEVKEKFYGCGSPIPPAIESKICLDLGSGSGRDVYVMSKLVGQNGKVIGIDMTEEQLKVATNHVEFHKEKFGYKTSNVDFRRGYIEDLSPIENESIDVVTSNCVLNLSPKKTKVFSEIMRVLKTGGEFYFSDIFSDRRIPEQLQIDPVIRGECLGGAMYVEDFRRTMAKVGVFDYRIMSSSKLDIYQEEVKEKLGNINFYSITVRAFKLDLEDRCEDFGQIATYKGTVKHHPNKFALDDHHVFEVNKPMLVCGNTARMLSMTRFKDHFDVKGDESTHYGLFDCEPMSNEPGACC